MIRYCLDCNTELCLEGFNTHGKKYCNERCRIRAQTKRRAAPPQVKNCQLCGNQYTAVGPQKFCSSKCKGKTRYRREKAEGKLEYNPDNYQIIISDPAQHEKRKGHARKSHGKVRRWLAEYKLSIGCVDCGYREHAAALQLDHEGEKTISISSARSSIARLQNEIDKGDCKVRCANCHAVVTWKRREAALGR